MTVARHDSLFVSGILYSYRPKRRLNSQNALILQVCHNSGPVLDGALSARQLPLCLTELAFSKAHSAAPDLVELRILRHAGYRSLRVQNNMLSQER
jgi:hypothetical protein